MAWQIPKLAGMGLAGLLSVETQQSPAPADLPLQTDTEVSAALSDTVVHDPPPREQPLRPGLAASLFGFFATGAVAAATPPKNKPALKLTSSAQTDKGNVRHSNEDAFFYSDPRGLYIVADGMGGHQAGEVAAGIAVDIIPRELGIADIATQDLNDAKTSIVRAVATAKRQIIREAYNTPNKHGMGTTVALVAMHGEKAIVAHAGDSRVYLLRGDSLIQLTTDHSLVQQKIDKHELSREEARVHQHRNIITRALSSYSEFDDCDVEDYLAMPGDIFLLCSDGLTGEVEDEKIQELLKQNKPPCEIARDLIAAAKNSGGNDNITALVVKVSEAESQNPNPTLVPL